MASNRKSFQSRTKSSRQKKPPQKVLESADTWKSRVAVDTSSNIYKGRLGVKRAFSCILKNYLSIDELARFENYEISMAM